MAKKILAIFVVSILLCSYIIPTTSAFADVVIGDNDSYAVTELGIQNGKKIATMEAILQLLESGVSEINFNDISDLDNYLENFYDELTNVNYQDVSNEILAGAYNDVKELKQWIDDRGEYIATYYKDFLNSADQGLSDIFNEFQLKLPKSKLVGTTLNGFRSLSRFERQQPTPQPEPDYSFILTDNDFYITSSSNEKYIGSGAYTSLSATQYPNNTNENGYYNAWMSNDRAQNYTFFNKNNITPNGEVWTNMFYISPLTTIYINNTSNGYTVTYSNFSNDYIKYNTQNVYGVSISGTSTVLDNYNSKYWRMYSQIATSSSFNPQTSFTGLSTAINYIHNHFRHYNLYVDGELWLMSNYTNNPTLDIDGFIKLYGNNNPIQYEFPQGTQIDYNALYTTIYNAIRDNLPLDMQTINNNQVYYDSHDTVYSPTIYNYYGKDGDDENDWIDSILDYATIPDFNSVLGTVAVLDAPFVNGITIINTGITDVIPTEILIILGAGFVLVLFVCIINRMSE